MKRKFSVYQTQARQAVGGSQSDFGSARSLWGDKGAPKKWTSFMGLAHDGVGAAERGDAAPEVLAAREKQGMFAGTPSDFQQVASGLGTDEQTRQLAMKMGYSPEKVGNTPIEELKRELLIRFGGTTQSGEEQVNIITEDEKAAGVKGVTQEEKDLGLKPQGTIFPMGGRPTPYSGSKGHAIPTLPGGGIASAGLSGAPALHPSIPQQMGPAPADSGGGALGISTTNMDPQHIINLNPNRFPLPNPYVDNFSIQRDPPTTNYSRVDSTKRRKQVSVSEPYVPSSSSMKNEVLREKLRLAKERLETFPDRSGSRTRRMKREKKREEGGGIRDYE